MLNDTVRLVRSFHNISKSETAEKVGLSRSYVTELESGAKKVTLEVLQKYSEAFNIPVSSLLLFDEHAKDSSFAENVRVSVSGKVIKMLNWLADISDDQRESNRV